MVNCYLCDKKAELVCLKCGQDVCKEHYQMGMCTECYNRRLKSIKIIINIIIIASLIGIPVILLIIFFF